MSDMAGVAKQQKQCDDGSSINSLKPEELALILEKVADKKDLPEISKDFLRARCFTLKRFTCLLPSLVGVVLPSSRNLLSFKSSLPLGNSDLELLARSCPKLEKLLLGRERPQPLDVDVDVDVDVDFDDNGVSELRVCSNLEVVVLKGRVNVGELGVVTMVRGTPKLQSLDLEGCRNVTDETLRAIGELTDLRDLVLKDCSQITDVGLNYLLDGELKSRLANLSLANCGMGITDAGIEAISHVEGLWGLDISMLPNVTDLSLVEISKRCQSLHSLSVNGCGAVTGEGVRALTSCVWIGVLEVANCPSVTWDDVKFVGSALAVLEFLSLDRMLKNPVPEEAGFKEFLQFGDNHVLATWI